MKLEKSLNNLKCVERLKTPIHSIPSPKGAITHPLINSGLLFLLFLIDLIIRNTCGKFQSNTSSGYLENLENIHLHANFNLGILSPKGAITHP